MKLRLACILILWGATKAANGTTIDMTPRPVFLLRSGGFVAQDSPTSVSVYDGSGKSIKKLSSSRITHIAVTSGETHVVLTCGDGTVTVGDLQTGRIVWSKPSAFTHLRYIYDTSFSQDGHVQTPFLSPLRRIVFAAQRHWI